MRLLIASLAALAAVAFAAPSYAQTQDDSRAPAPVPTAKPKPGTAAYCQSLKTSSSRSSCLKKVSAAPRPRRPRRPPPRRRRRPRRPRRRRPRPSSPTSASSHPVPRRRRRRRAPSPFRRCRRRRSKLASLRAGRRDRVCPPIFRESDMAAHSAALISTEELARRMGAPALRLFDCTTYLRPRPEGGYNVESGRANYDKGHIPGAAFLDLPGRAFRARLQAALHPAARSASSPRPLPPRASGMAPSSCSTATRRRTGRRASGGCCAPSASTMPRSSTAGSTSGRPRTGRWRPRPRPIRRRR